MNSEQLRNLAHFIERLNAITSDTGMHLYWYNGTLCIDNADDASLADLAYDRSEGYTVTELR